MRIPRCTLAGFVGLCLIAAIGARGHARQDIAARSTQALAAAEARVGKTSPDLLPIIDRLARAALRQGALGNAAALRRRALDIAIAAFGRDAVRTADAMAALALVDIDRRRYLDAEPLLIIAERALAARDGGRSSTLAAIDAGLARIALARGETRMAESWARRAVAIAGADPRLRSAEPLRTLGAVLTAGERFDEAERVLSEALAQDRRRHGPDATETARSLSRLGNLHMRAGRAQDALPLLENAAAIDQDRLGPAHPFIADDLYDLALAYDALQRDDMARRALRAAIAVLEGGAGRDTPRVAYAEIELSRLYRRQGDTAAADAAFKDARRILNKAEAEEHRRERRL